MALYHCWLRVPNIVIKARTDTQANRLARNSVEERVIQLRTQMERSHPDIYRDGNAVEIEALVCEKQGEESRAGGEWIFAAKLRCLVDLDPEAAAQTPDLLVPVEAGTSSKAA